MRRRTFIKNTGTAGLLTLLSPSIAISALNEERSLDLEQDFVRPPVSAYPQCLWFWMNGQVSKEGITMDMEAMKAVGIGGVFHFDVGTDIPAGPVHYLSAEWLELKKHAIREAERLGLGFVLHNCPGWSASGGPWITPELSMQQVTWSEVYVSGGKEIDIFLPKPFHKLDYYRDITVLAFPSLRGEAPLQTFRATTNNGVVDRTKLTGADPQGITVTVAENNQPAWLQFVFDAPYEAQSITFLISSTEKNNGGAQVDYNKRTSVLLQSSDDGHNFSDVVTINTGLEAELAQGDKFITYDFPATKARFFRITTTNSRRFAQVRFSGITRLNNWMEKSGYRYQFSGEGTSSLFTDNQQHIVEGSILPLHSIYDISQCADHEGRLRWKAPPGDWTILRIGYTPVGTLNRAAPDQGIGLECDKYSRKAFDFHFKHMMAPFLPLLQALAKKGVAGVEIDSYEARSQNWTPLFAQEFIQRNGYEIIKYLPILTGRIVQNIDTSERFLWDFRQTQAGLIADHYYGRFATLCREHQLTAYIQPYDRGPMEEMQIGSKVDVNIGESWFGLHTALQSNRTLDRTLKLAASIAHTNGQKVIGAEAFTAEPESGRWQEYPFSLKALGDKMFARGINKMIIHRFAHQPHPTAAPGMTMGPWGIHFDRTNTWWPQAKGWLTYVARCQSLLQQGLFVADLAYFTGEDANLYTKVNRGELHPVPPAGYDYDMINGDTILRNTRIDNGQIILPDGMSYRMLVLQNFKAITRELLLKLRELVQQGMVLVGMRPEHSLGLKAYADKDAAFHQITQELWGDIDGTNVTKNKIGKGCVYYGPSLQSIFQETMIKPDFEAVTKEGKAPVHYIHRKSGDTDYYFITNQRRTYEQLTCTFRVNQKQPELWDAVTGRMTPIPIYETVDGHIRLPLQLAPYESAFIVFRKSASPKRLHAILKENKIILSTDPVHHAPSKLYNEVADNFTITFWAKPELSIMLQPSIFSEGIKHPWTDYYAVYPIAGKVLYGEGHATCGITVGRNGVAVWEHGGEAPVLVLPVAVSISGWTHIAIVYRNGVPSVYVAGKKTGEGKKGTFIVHPSPGDINPEHSSYYNGDMTPVQLTATVLSEEEIGQLASKQTKTERSPFAVEITGNQQPSLLFRQNGKYSLRNHTGKNIQLAISGIPEPMELKGPWHVHFPSSKGAPSEVVLPSLISLHKHENEGVRYFSGTALYKTEFTFNKMPAEQHLYLDLGSVEVIAEVSLNGEDLGVLWKRPYSVDITRAVRMGTNQLAIKVTNLWPNRLIGDEQIPDQNKFSPGAGSSGIESLFNGGILELPQWYVNGRPKPDNGRITFTTWKHYHKDSPLLESGLIGPVILKIGVLRTI